MGGRRPRRKLVTKSELLKAYRRCMSRELAGKKYPSRAAVFQAFRAAAKKCKEEIRKLGTTPTQTSQKGI